MRRLLAVLAVAGACAGAAGAETFPPTPVSFHAAALPSAEVPNAPGSMAFPFFLSILPAVPEARSEAELLDLYQRAGAAYGVPWQVLAAVNKVESDFGRNMGPSSAGAVGWMQFLPSTWELWGTDANGDGMADPWNPEDAVFSAARYLAAASAHENLPAAIFAYNHADWYVNDVLTLAGLYAGGQSLDVALPFGLGSQFLFRVDDIDQRLEEARQAVEAARQAVARTEEELDRLSWRTLETEQRAGNPELSAADFRLLEAQAGSLTEAQEELEARLAGERAALDEALARLHDLTWETSAITFVRPLSSTLGGLLHSESHVFPVAGPASFTDDFAAPRADTGWHHGNDIFAPVGASVVAVADGELLSVGWNDLGGLRLWLRDGAGNEYYYAHLSAFAAGVQDGSLVRAGDVLGYVGASGDAVGTTPHLHFEIHPSPLAGLAYDGVVDPYGYLSSWRRLDGGALFAPEGEAVRSLAAAAPTVAVPLAGPVFTVVGEEPVVTFTR